MTRTQISLEERHYRYLKARTVESGLSLSAVLREIIDEKIADAELRGPRLASFAGAWMAGGVSGADHDRILAESLQRAESDAGE